MKWFSGAEVFYHLKSYDKRGRNSVTVGDTENFIDSKIVEREILQMKGGLRFELGSRFEMVFGGRSCFTIWAEVVLPCVFPRPPTPISRPWGGG